MNDTVVVEIGADGPADGPAAPTPLDATGADSFARDAEHAAGFFTPARLSLIHI